MCENFAGSNEIVNLTGEMVTVSYYTIEEMLGDGKKYGVKLCSKSKDALIDSVHCYLTESPDHIGFIVDYLMKHVVTPVGLEEVIDLVYDMYDYA